jgi:regulator of protease activity HflC (stomatin/prohibitin superfamily)
MSPAAYGSSREVTIKPKTVAWWIGIGIFLIIALIVYNSIVVTIPQGHVGVVYDTTRGGILNKELKPGWNTITPFIQRVTVYPTAFRTYTMSQKDEEGARRGDDSVKITTSDNQVMQQDISVTYRILGGWAPKIFDNFKGADIEHIEDSFIRRSIITACDTESGTQFTILEAYGAKKPQFSKRITEELNKLLKIQGFEVVAVNLGESYLDSPEVKRAIEAPLKAQAASKEAEAQLAMKEAQAKQLVIEAEAYAKATKIKAEADAYANQKQTSTLSPLLVEKMRIEKLNPNVEVIYLPNNASIVTGMPGLTGK